jgi:hypothetical protein
MQFNGKKDFKIFLIKDRYWDRENVSSVEKEVINKDSVRTANEQAAVATDTAGSPSY